MGKALVFKNSVNFASIALTTINIDSDPVACTGISLASDTYSITGYDAVTVEYTLTPSDTTEDVTWATSDSTILTVTDGVITVVGIGTCTITATCGEYSASATVTVNIAYIPKWNFGLPAAQGVYIKWSNTYGRILASGSGAQAGTHELVESTATESHLVPIKLPNNTASVRVSIDSTQTAMLVSGAYHGIIFGADTACGDSTFPDAVTLVSEETFKLRADITETVAVPSGADCMVVYVRTATTYTASDNAETVANTIGVTIEFLTE